MAITIHPTAEVSNEAKIGEGTRIYYPIPINEEGYYKGLGYRVNTPISSAAAKKVLSLLIHPSLSKEDLGRIISGVKRTR